MEQTREAQTQELWDKMVRNSIYPLTANNMYGVMGRDAFRPESITEKGKEIIRQFQAFADEHFKNNWHDDDSTEKSQ